MKPIALACVAFACLGSSLAHAEEAAPPAHPKRTVAVTISPIHLISPIVEITTEVTVAERIGVAGILGAGTMKVENVEDPISVFELGLQGRYYVLGKYTHRAQVGAELLYVHADGANEGLTATADGFAIGPFAGYKYTADIGFTFDAQLGFQRVGVGSEASNGTTTERKDWIALLNLNVGWSF